LKEWQIREIGKALSEADQGDFAADKEVDLVLTRSSTAVEYRPKR